jgi:bacteriocin biosynthesis cyclodehydratase domain-containing protein
MVLKLDPRFPLVWRSPTSLQLGVDPAIVTLHDVSETTERLIAALVAGVGLPGLTMLARGRLSERDELLRRFEPVLLPEAPPTTVEPVSPIVAVTGTGRTAEAIAATLHGEGMRVVAAETHDRPDFAVAIAHHVLPPELHGHWLRRDVAHLPVVLSESATTIGPLVRPGDGPCLHCLELHHRDADPAWPAIAAQLLGRRSRVESATGASEAAAVVGRIVLAWADGADVGRASIRLDAATGERTERAVSAHPECGCRGVSDLFPPDFGASSGDQPMRRLRLAPS